MAAANNNIEKETLLTWNCGLYLSVDYLLASARGDLAKSRFEFAHVECERKTP